MFSNCSVFFHVVLLCLLMIVMVKKDNDPLSERTSSTGHYLLNLVQTLFSTETFLSQLFFFQTQLDKLQKEIAAVAKKTGISSATKLALITPKEAQEDFIPDIEWWDGNILPAGNYINLPNEGIDATVVGVTALVEHPVQKHPAGKS